MLQANGFDAKNIAGSYEFVKAYEEMMCYNYKSRNNIMVAESYVEGEWI